MTADEFRANKELVIGLRTLLENDIFKLAQEVLANDQNPVQIVADAVTPHYAHIQFGQLIGWTQYPVVLALLAQHPETPPAMADDPTYPDPLAPPPPAEE